jgi:hypothetical protein
MTEGLPGLRQYTVIPATLLPSALAVARVAGMVAAVLFPYRGAKASKDLVAEESAGTSNAYTVERVWKLISK